MFKLLTEEQREQVLREYKARRVIVTLYSLILVLVVGVVGLLPSYVLSNARRNEVAERTRIISESEFKGDEQELEAWLNSINSRLNILAPSLDKDRPSNLIEKVLAQKGSGVKITNLSVLKEEGDKLVLNVGGIAFDRQTLVAFKDRINDSGDFSGAILPISNLAQDSNINFQMSFSPVISKTQTP